MKLIFAGIAVVIMLEAGPAVGGWTLSLGGDHPAAAGSWHAQGVGTETPYVLVLGVAQDGGYPQAGTTHPGWSDLSRRRLVSSLAVVDPEGGGWWLFDATPDFPDQLARLDHLAPRPERPEPDGIFLTHAHIGHYTGLMYLGREAMGTDSVPVHVMPRMADYLATNGPWSQLVRLGNIELRVMAEGRPVKLNRRITVTPFRVPHREEYAEVVGFVIEGPNRSALFIPDIDSWTDLDAQGVRIEDLIARVDVAYLDGTFYSTDEVPGRDNSQFPHPPINRSIQRFLTLPAAERNKIRFIHFNRTNPVLDTASEAARDVRRAGFNLAEEMERQSL